MKRAWMVLAVMGLVALGASPLRAQSTRDLVGKDPPAIVANSWINSDKPLTLDELKGKAVLLEVHVREGELYALRFPYRIHLGEHARDRL